MILSSAIQAPVSSSNPHTSLQSWKLSNGLSNVDDLYALVQICSVLDRLAVDSAGGTESKHVTATLEHRWARLHIQLPVPSSSSSLITESSSGGLSIFTPCPP